MFALRSHLAVAGLGGFCIVADGAALVRLSRSELAAPKQKLRACSVSCVQTLTASCAGGQFSTSPLGCAASTLAGRGSSLRTPTRIVDELISAAARWRLFRQRRLALLSRLTRIYDDEGVLENGAALPPWSDCHASDCRWKGVQSAQKPGFTKPNSELGGMPPWIGKLYRSGTSRASTSSATASTASRPSTPRLDVHHHDLHALLDRLDQRGRLTGRRPERTSVRRY